jgi:hypothetical protein
MKIRVLQVLTLLHRMGKTNNKFATLKRVYRCWHENPSEAAVGIYVEV